MMIFQRLAIAAAAVFILTAAPALTDGGRAWASSIAVLVNDDPITEYDVKQRTTLIRLTSGGAGSRQQAVDELIEERLKQQAATRLGVTANEAEVEQAYGTIAQRVKLSPSQLGQALQSQGVNPETLKSRLRADLAWRDVVRGRMRQEVNIRDSDIQAQLSKRGDEAKATSYRYTMQPVIFVIPQDSSAAYKNQRRQEAARYASQFSGCDSARELAKNYRDTVVQSLIRRNSAELADELKAKLEQIPVGKAGSPDEVANGMQILGI